MALSSAASSSSRLNAGDSTSFYFPNCRKDANCHCDICMESFNATRDLHSALKFPPKNTNKNKNNKNPSPLSTLEPVSSISIIPRSPGLKSTAKSRPIEKVKKKEKSMSWGFGFKVLVVIFGVLVFFAVDSGVLNVRLRRFGPKLGVEIVRELGEEARVSRKELKGKLEVVEMKVEGIVGGGGVFNCSSLDSVWKLNQEESHHLFFQWRCVIFKSMAEQLSVWGSPLQTSGILIAGASPRSLTLLSGTITECSEGSLLPTSRTSNDSSWTLEKWSSAVVQLEKETWVVEYHTSVLFQGRLGLIQYMWEILRVRMQRLVKKLKWKLLNRSLEGALYRNSREKHFEHPT